MLKKLSVHHELWVKMLINLGCDLSLAEDLVQDMYIRLHDLVTDESKIMYGDDVNKYFVYITIRNLYYNHLRVNNKYGFKDFEDNNVEEDVDYDEGRDYATVSILDSMRDIVSEWNTYDKRLFELYFGVRISKNSIRVTKGKSLREIAKGVGISAGSIFHSIKNFKTIFKNELGEDYEDYFNGEYDRI